MIDLIKSVNLSVSIGYNRAVITIQTIKGKFWIKYTENKAFVMELDNRYDKEEKDFLTNLITPLLEIGGLSSSEKVNLLLHKLSEIIKTLKV